MNDAVTSINESYVESEKRVLDPSLLDKSLIERMPQPTGWRMLILPYRGKATTEGGIHIPNQVLDDGQIQTVVGYILRQGTLAYKDTNKFPNGQWCDKDDFVAYGRHVGHKFVYKGVRLILLFDDQIIMKVDDPRYLDTMFNLTTEAA